MKIKIAYFPFPTVMDASTSDVTKTVLQYCRWTTDKTIGGSFSHHNFLTSISNFKITPLSTVLKEWRKIFSISGCILHNSNVMHEKTAVFNIPGRYELCVLQRTLMFLGKNCLPLSVLLYVCGNFQTLFRSRIVVCSGTNQSFTGAISEV